MPANHNEIEIPPNSRINEVGAEVLAEQARRALSQDSSTPPPNLNLQLQPDWAEVARQKRAERESDQDLVRNGVGVDGKVTVKPPKSDEDDQPLTDKLTDRFIPGFGRVESLDPNNKWRFDYVDPGRCKTKASVGMCFTMDFK